MEGEVIAGAEQTIRRFRPVLYVENDRPEHSAALIHQVLDLGYRLYWHLLPLFNPQNYFGVAENVFGRIVSVNMLGLPASVTQEVQGLHEITDPEDRWPGELRKVRPEERRGASAANPRSRPSRTRAGRPRRDDEDTPRLLCKYPLSPQAWDTSFSLIR